MNVSHRPSSWLACAWNSQSSELSASAMKPSMLVAVKYCVLPPAAALRWLPGRPRRRLDGGGPSGSALGGDLKHRLEAFRHLRARALVLVLEVAEDVGAGVQRRADPAGPRGSSSSVYSVLRRRRYPAGSHDRSSGSGVLLVGLGHAPCDALRRAVGRAPRSTTGGGTPSRTRRAVRPAGPHERLDQRASYCSDGGHWKSTQPSRSPSILARVEEVAHVLVGVLQPLEVRDALVRLQREHEARARPARATS